MQEETQWVVLKTALNKMDADLTKVFLEAEGIPVIIQGDNAGGIRPDLNFGSSIRILVREQDAIEAKELLNVGQGTP